ncbi:MAG TPA: hypothetical protein VLL52_21320 [Anaerolineae bacterium]|nr:hypothetical protein [Anaerolineae bacterium]
MQIDRVDRTRTVHSNGLSTQLIIGLILGVALLAFEIFNFDTTKYALNNLLGETSFVGVTWATILAIAFCAIDFAGLTHLMTPETGRDEPKEIWFLMGAWLLGATMNALMTWWAVSLTLLAHPLGNEILTREQLLKGVPIFVAILVWLTRILFIGALSIAGDQLLGQRDVSQAVATWQGARPQMVKPVMRSGRVGVESSSGPVIKRPAPAPAPSPATKPVANNSNNRRSGPAKRPGVTGPRPAQPARPARGPVTGPIPMRAEGHGSTRSMSAAQRMGRGSTNHNNQSGSGYNV